jgi:hypothetical protein
MDWKGSMLGLIRFKGYNLVIGYRIYRFIYYELEVKFFRY